MYSSGSMSITLETVDLLNNNKVYVKLPLFYNSSKIIEAIKEKYPNGKTCIYPMHTYTPKQLGLFVGFIERSQAKITELPIILDIMHCLIDENGILTIQEYVYEYVKRCIRNSIDNQFCSHHKQASASTQELSPRCKIIVAYGIMKTMAYALGLFDEYFQKSFLQNYPELAKYYRCPRNIPILRNVTIQN